MLLLAMAGPTLAAGDDDIPGAPLSLGVAVAQWVGGADASDVYAIELVAGEEVHIRCDPGTVGSATGSLHLLVPGALTLSVAQLFDEVTYTLRAGSPTRSWADYDYIAPKSGTYYLWVQSDTGTLNYSLGVSRTSRAPLDLTADADDIPGTAVLAGTHCGVVSSLADRNDIYGVELTAGKKVTLRLMPLTPYRNTFSAYAYLNLLDPDTPSLAGYFGHAVAGLILAQNGVGPADRKTAEIEYTPTRTGRYFVWVSAAMSPYGYNFAYQLSVAGSTDDQTAPPQFSDIEGSSYAPAIMELARRGIIGGFDDGTFRPDDHVSRQQFAKMIVKTLDLTVTGSEASPFTDVTPGQGADPLYPDKYIAVCAEAGVTRGFTATSFKPYDAITRQQLISMVTRGAGTSEPPIGFTPDFSPAQFYPNEHYLNARKAAHAGLLESLQGLGPNYDFFLPASRGECAQLLFNLLSGR